MNRHHYTHKAPTGDLAIFLHNEDAKDRHEDNVQKTAEGLKEYALTDQPTFDQLDDDYEVIDRGQIQRALRSLPKARKGCRISMDAVFTALSNIEQSLEVACRNEVE